MAHSGTQRVWILGAGFSRSLGGPLLNDLLSQGEWALFQARFRKLADLCAPIIDVFRWGNGGGPDRPNLWPNAESFLEFLDGAETGSAAEVILVQALIDTVDEGAFDIEKFDLDGLRLWARKAITASCWGFVLDKPRAVFTERWMPYVGWYNALREGDTIVTFNYDLVVERASGERVTVVTLGPLWDSEEARKRVRLLKLHGSVNWKERKPMAGDEVPVETIPDDQILIGPYESVIAHPGRSKQAVTESLKLLWRYAIQAISEAREVYMIGYSMPPSDNGSKKRILDAIHHNSHRNDGIDIHLVLGNDLAAATRLRTMLEFNSRVLSRPDRVHVHPVNAEDFLLLRSER